MTTRLRPIVERRGFPVGAAPLRPGNLSLLVLLALVFASFAVGTIAMADVVTSIARPI